MESLWLLIVVILGTGVVAMDPETQSFWGTQCAGSSSHSSMGSWALLLFYLGLVLVGVSLTAYLYQVVLRACAPSTNKQPPV